MSEPAAKSRFADAPIGWSCSVVSAAAFALLPVLSIASPTFNPAHPWLFPIGAVAFVANLRGGLSPLVRGLAAVAQAFCVFELLGFSVAVALMVRKGGWHAVEWWLAAATWGLFSVSVLAFFSSVRGVRSR